MISKYVFWGKIFSFVWMEVKIEAGENLKSNSKYYENVMVKVRMKYC